MLNTRQQIPADIAYMDDLVKIHLDIDGEEHAFIITKHDLAELHHTKGALIREISVT